MGLNSKIIIHLMGLLLLFNGGFMVLAALVSGLYADGATLGISVAAVTTLFVGTVAMYLTRGHKKEVKRKEGYIIVAMGWIIMSASGVLPYILSGSIPELSNAFFETMSGYTTTGATILDDIESMPEGILFWRSLTHWIGAVSYTHLTLPTTSALCRSRGSPYH